MEVSLILVVQSHPIPYTESETSKHNFLAFIIYLESADAIPLHSHNQKFDFISLGH